MSVSLKKPETRFKALTVKVWKASRTLIRTTSISARLKWQIMSWRMNHVGAIIEDPEMVELLLLTSMIGQELILYIE